MVARAKRTAKSRAASGECVASVVIRTRYRAGTTCGGRKDRTSDKSLSRSFVGIFIVLIPRCVQYTAINPRPCFRYRRTLTLSAEIPSIVESQLKPGSRRQPAPGMQRSGEWGVRFSRCLPLVGRQERAKSCTR